MRAVKTSKLRVPNAIDFWRGVALVMIFINHVPGSVFSILTLRNYAISDAAELFVFLAGCSMAYFVGAPGKRKPALHIVARLLKRAFEIWRAQIVVISAAIALLGSFALALNDPLLLEWHNAGPAYFDTVRSSIGLVFLTYQIGYFNILPLYVVLLLMSPVLVLLSLRSRTLAIAVSLGLYAVTLTTQITLPSWPVEGTWHFNPLSWQVLILLGFLCTISPDQTRISNRSLHDFGRPRQWWWRWVRSSSGWMSGPIQWRCRSRVYSFFSTKLICRRSECLICWHSPSYFFQYSPLSHREPTG